MRYFTKIHDFYKSKEWKDLKTVLMEKRQNEQGELLCEHCKKPMLFSYDCIPHHYKVPLTLDNVNNPDISLNEDNLMLVHFRCHNELEHRFTNYKRKVYLVVGAPCSGKSSWVKENATKDDLVLDFDNIWEMISTNPRYMKPNKLKPVAFALRDCLMEQIKMRNGKWDNAYVLITEPYVMNRKRMIDSLGVDEIIYINPEREICLQRLYDNPQGRDIELYEKLINDFYDNYQEEE